MALNIVSRAYVYIISMGYKIFLWSDTIQKWFCWLREIHVKDVNKFNIVISIGTTINNFIDTNGVAFYLTCVFCHPQKKDIWQLSPQNDYYMYGGHSVVYGYQVEMFLPHHNIVINIDD